jgi:putative membrane protein
MKSFLKCALVTGIALELASLIVPGIKIPTIEGLVLATLLLTALNEFVRPVVVLLSLPLLIFTLGLFMLVINALLLDWVGHLHFLEGRFAVDTFWSAFWGSLIISAASLILKPLVKGNRTSVQFHRGKPPAPPRPPDDDGGNNIIDV